MATQKFKLRVRQFKQNAFSNWNIKLTQRMRNHKPYTSKYYAQTKLTSYNFNFN